MIPFKTDFVNLVFRTFVDHKNQIGQSALSGRLSAVRHRHVGVTRTLIVLFDITTGFENLFVAHRAASFDFRLLGQLLVGVNRIADESHTTEGSARRHLCDQFHTTVDRLGEESNVLNKTRAIERLDVVIQTFCAIGRT